MHCRKREHVDQATGPELRPIVTGTDKSQCSLLGYQRDIYTELTAAVIDRHDGSTDRRIRYLSLNSEYIPESGPRAAAMQMQQDMIFI